MDLGPGEVRVRVAYTGICGTDLHVFHGSMDQRVKPPAVLGHEASGHVAAVGENVTAWSEGDPVTVMPLVWCGDCGACRAGHTHICQRLDFVGLDLELVAECRGLGVQAIPGVATASEVQAAVRAGLEGRKAVSCGAARRA